MPWLAAAPALAYLAVVFAAPVASLALASFVTPAGIGLGAYAEFLTDPRHQQSVFNTLRLATFTSLVCLVIGLPYGLLMARLSRRWQAVLLVLLLLPMASSLVVRTFGWTILLRRDGLLNAALTGTGLIDRPMRLIFTEFGLVLGTVSLKLPLMVLPVYSLARLIPRDLTPSALCLGASHLYALRRVTLPLVAPGAVLGFAFVFAQSAAAYVIPAMLAGSRLKTMSVTIVESYAVLQNAALGATTSVLLLAIVISVVALAGGLAGRMGPKR